MMTQEDWERAIDASGDYATWGVYCDWLQERGDPMWEPLALLNEYGFPNGSDGWHRAFRSHLLCTPDLAWHHWNIREWRIAYARVYMLADDPTRREYAASRTPVKRVAS